MCACVSVCACGIIIISLYSFKTLAPFVHAHVLCAAVCMQFIYVFSGYILFSPHAARRLLLFEKVRDMVGLRFAPIVLTQLDGNPAYLLSESPLDYCDLIS